MKASILKSFQTVVLSAVFYSISAAPVLAQPNNNTIGYLGGSFGQSSFKLQNGLPKTAVDERDRELKFYGGFALSQNFGVEAGYVRLGKLKDTFVLNSLPITQSASGRSFYVAATGKAALTESFAINGKIGLSFGKLTGTNLLPTSESLIGSKRSAMFGVGAEYKINPSVSLTADYDNYGKISNKVKASAFLLGARVNF